MDMGWRGEEAGEDEVADDLPQPPDSGTNEGLGEDEKPPGRVRLGGEVGLTGADAARVDAEVGAEAGA